MSKHCMFYPFPESEMGEDAGSMIKDPKVSQLLCLDAVWDVDHSRGTSMFGITMPHTDERRGKNIYQDVLASMDPDTTLYVCGHASAGGKLFSSPDDKVNIMASTMAGYLQSLDKDWPGRVKIYGCYSGSAWTITVPILGFCLWRSQPFAQQVYDLLKVTHTQVQVFGYTHTVPMSPTKRLGEKELHKYVDDAKTSRARQYLVRVQ